MYVPDHFALTPEQAHEILSRKQAANLVTHHASGLHATLAPFFHVEGGEFGTLVTHLVRTNPQAREPIDGEALVILDVDDAYISPAWYPTAAASPEVPTWDYITVHAWGEMTVHDDPEWALRAASALTTRYESDAVLHAVGPERLERMARAIVGAEVRLTRVVGKAKMSQNRHPVDVAGVAEALAERGHDDLAGFMRDVSLPYARGRYELLADLRETRGPGKLRLSAAADVLGGDVGVDSHAADRGDVDDIREIRPRG